MDFQVQELRRISLPRLKGNLSTLMPLPYQLIIEISSNTDGSVPLQNYLGCDVWSKINHCRADFNWRYFCSSWSSISIILFSISISHYLRTPSNELSMRMSLLSILDCQPNSAKSSASWSLSTKGKTISCNFLTLCTISYLDRSSSVLLVSYFLGLPE